MKRPLSMLLLALFVMGATPAQPPAPIVALMQAVIDAANANDAAKLAGIYTNDAVIIDENAPFIWHGATAGVKWLHGVQRVLDTRHATLRAAALPITEYRCDRECDDAYVIQPLRITVSSGNKTKLERGTQTYTFHEENGTWKISSAVWTTKP